MIGRHQLIRHGVDVVEHEVGRGFERDTEQLAGTDRVVQRARRDVPEVSMADPVGAEQHRKRNPPVYKGLGVPECRCGDDQLVDTRAAPEQPQDLVHVGGAARLGVRSQRVLVDHARELGDPFVEVRRHPVADRPRRRDQIGERLARSSVVLSVEGPPDLRLGNHSPPMIIPVSPRLWKA